MEETYNNAVSKISTETNKDHHIVNTNAVGKKNYIFVYFDTV